MKDMNNKNNTDNTVNTDINMNNGSNYIDTNDNNEIKGQKNVNNKGLFAIFAVLIVLIIGSVIAYEKLGENYEMPIVSGEDLSDSNNEELQDAPDFKVEDNSGEVVKLSDMKGKPVVVNFWASWCGPCKSEMPDFNKLYKKYEDEIQFMMVNMTDGGQETKDSASTFIQKQGYEFPVYYDVEYSASNAYNVMSIPATYFITKDGKIAAYANGAINESALEDGISKIK